MSDERAHDYRLRLVWEGNLGDGTAEYAGYARRFRVLAEGKADLLGTANPAFRGEANLHNPEELLLAALAACHMLFYLSLCARHGVTVVRYSDSPQGELRLNASGGGSFTEITLHPRVTVRRGSDPGLATTLHERARELCFLANSVSFPVRHRSAIEVEADAVPAADAIPVALNGGAR